MFAQVIRAKVLDPQAVSNQFRRWEAEVAPGASGWHDLTAGITEEGELIAVARFDSVEHARDNSSREEQDAWWQQTRALLGDEPRFYESEDVTQLSDGPTRDAEFVQMMLAEVADRETVETLEEDLDEGFRRWRPDALGGYRVWLPDGRMLAVDYFSSEAEARAGEQTEPPQDVAEGFQRWMAQMSDQEWFDLRIPWIALS